MRIAGIVAEYNPFHNGHLRHIEQTRKLSRCDAVVAVMSGNFVQRGEPAAFDKWARTRMALSCGADAVFELPAFWALQPAEWFAYGGVAVLGELGADCLSFGAETPDIEKLRQLSRVWADEPEDLKAEIQLRMKQGKPHPKARAEALEAWLNDPIAADALAAPNSVLASMYLMWLEKLRSPMEPLAVERVGSGYHDEAIRGTIASATAVRKALFEGSGSWRGAVPEATADIINAEAEPVAQEQFAQMLLYALRAGKDLPDTAEGLDNRMRKAARTAGSLDSFFAATKCKRYPMARIKRAAMQALLGVSAQDIAQMREEKPIYARLLGYSRRAEGLIGELGKRAKIPFVARAPEFRPESAAMQRLWELDMLASDIYALASNTIGNRTAGRDFTERMIVV